MRRHFAILCVFALSVCLSTRAEEPPSAPLLPPADFYFSEKDPHVGDVERAFAEALKAIPTIQLNRVKIDDPAGAQAMKKAEESLGILEPGEMMLVFGPYYLVSKGDQRDIENFFLPMMQRLVGQMKGNNDFKGRLKPDLATYAQQIFGDGIEAKIRKGTENDEILYFRIEKGGKTAGWLVDAYHPIACPICNDAQFLLATDDKLTVLDVRPARGLERYGRPLTDSEAQAFVAQFKGKAPANVPIKVDGISRATKTSMAYQEVLNAVLKELSERAKQP